MKPATDRTLCLLLAALLGFALYRHMTTVPYPTAAAQSAADQATPLKIDPNTAPWWELTALPGVGEVTAKRIVDYREAWRRQRGLPPDAPVFRSAADLQRIKGIGPKKSKGVEPHLAFDAPTPSAVRP